MDAGDFFGRGWAVLPQALPPDVVAAFRDQVHSDLLDPDIPGESGGPVGIDARDPATWPRATQHRVVEVVPTGVGAHWAALEDPARVPALHAALDQLLGAGQWELPRNQQESGPCARRHWYCPVAFPEGRAVLGKERALAADLAKDAAWEAARPPWSPGDDAALLQTAGGRPAGSDRSAADCRVRRSELRAWEPAEDAKLRARWDATPDAEQPRWRRFESLFGGRRSGRCVRRRLAELGLAGAALGDPRGGAASADPGRSWRPVNRRGVRDRGWHVDIGPMNLFQTSWPRTPQGHRAQGVVVLLALSDWAAGCGGTSFVNGSPAWVRDELQRFRAQEGRYPTHSELNRASIAWAVGGLQDGSVRLDYDPSDSDSDSAGGWVVEQAVLRAGDVVLMHPWTVHAGTTNLGQQPRILANGMAMVKEECWKGQLEWLVAPPAS